MLGSSCGISTRQSRRDAALGASETLANYRADIDSVHDTVGLFLQIETEGDRRAGTAAGGSSGLLSADQLRAVVVHRLKSVGYEGDALAQLTESLLKVALDRLVFIVPREDQRYGFEVRSLQEFAAARTLMRGGYDDVKKRLAAVAPAPYWRNVVLFAIGKAFTGREPREDLQDLVTTICEDLDTHGPHALSLPGARLALDIIEDGIADRKPAYYRKFFGRAAGLLSLPDTASALRLGNAYREECRPTADRALTTADTLAATAFLARLEKAQVFWSKDALAQTWPSEESASRVAYERLVGDVTWSLERTAHAEELARRSEPSWVSGWLASHVPSHSWVAATEGLRADSVPHRVPLLPDDDDERRLFEPRVHYDVSRVSVDVETLEIVDAAAPTHHQWRLLLAGLPWVRDQEQFGLAAALEAFAEIASNDHDSYFPWVLGWQLSSATSWASASDLRDLATKARAGKMGTPEVWSQAEGSVQNFV